MDMFIVLVCLICISVFIFASFFPCFYNVQIQEGLDNNSSANVIPIPSSGIPYGYYQVDKDNMAIVPVGFSATADKKQIYPTTNTDKIPIPSSGIPYGYYQVDGQNMAIVPYGYKASADKKSISPSDKSEIYSANEKALEDAAEKKRAGNTVASSSTIKKNDVPNTKYNNDISSLMNVQYHADEDVIRAQETNDSTSQLNNTWFLDPNGNRVIYPNMAVQGSITYYKPGSYPFGTSNYVPKYDDAIYLSQSTGMDTSTPLKDTAEMQAGFCSFHRKNPSKIEEMCKQLDKNTCSSTSCCVLLGGASCVAGNETGPTQKSNYADIFVRNKDYYYYQSKCYGNCNYTDQKEK